jgi:hypothetical protein
MEGFFLNSQGYNSLAKCIERVPELVTIFAGFFFLSPPLFMTHHHPWCVQKVVESTSYSTALQIVFPVR